MGWIGAATLEWSRRADLLKRRVGEMTEDKRCTDGDWQNKTTTIPLNYCPMTLVIPHKTDITVYMYYSTYRNTPNEKDESAQPSCASLLAWSSSGNTRLHPSDVPEHLCGIFSSSLFADAISERLSHHT
jgi:hypothetical protein